MEIDLSNNPIQCDKRMCWAKLNTTITVVRKACLGKQWVDVTVDDLACPPGKNFGLLCFTLNAIQYHKAYLDTP